MKYGIVVDSSCDLRSNDLQVEGVDFTIVPLKIIVGKNEYVDNDDIDVEAMLASMESCKEASMTACPSPGDFMEAYKKSENVFCFTLTSALSGTNNSAQLAKDQLIDEGFTGNVSVFDTKSTAGHMILCINKTIELIKAGKSYEEIVDEVSKYNESLQIVFTLGSYTNLIKTGRMSNFAGAVASTLNIRVICRNTPEGEIQIVKKTRGQKAAYANMVELMLEKKSLDGQTVYISHCDNEEGALHLKKMLEEKVNSVNVYIKNCKGLTTFYAMRGGIIIGY